MMRPVLLVAALGLAAAFVAPPAQSTHGSRSVARTATSSISMKIFDWKRRTETYSEDTELSLHNLRPAPGSAHRKIRKCRGMGSGKGGPGGFGMRGQNSRGGRPTRQGFEGGQTPLYRRIPKLRGQPMGAGHTKNEYGLIKLDYLNNVADGSEVTYEQLLGAGAMTKVRHTMVKVVGGGDLLRTGLVVKAHAFTVSARQAITDKGGECVVIPPYPTSKVAEPVGGEK